MYTWRMALSEFFPYFLILGLYGFVISFLSSFIEKSLAESSSNYMSLVGSNFAVSLAGIGVVGFLWCFQGLMREDLRIMLSPVIAFLVMYVLKLVLRSSWPMAFIHPVIFSLLPVCGILYLFALGSSWKN